MANAAAGRKAPNRAPASALINPALIPPAFQGIYDETHVSEKTGQVKWGWQEWSLLTPRVHKHILKHGRTGLTAAVVAAQRAVLPKKYQRSPDSLSVACTAKRNSFDVYDLIKFIAAMQTPPAPAAAVKKMPALKLVKPAKATTAKPTPSEPTLEPVKAPSPIPQRMLTSVEFYTLAGMSESVFYAHLKEGLLPPAVMVNGKRLFKHQDLEAYLALRATLKNGWAFKSYMRAEKAKGHQLTAPAPAPAEPTPEPQSTASATVDSFLDLPARAFLPLLKEGLKDMVRGLMLEERQATRSLLQELFTGHTPKPRTRASIKEAKPEVDTPETVAEKAQLPGAVLQMAQDTLLEREREVRELQARVIGHQPAEPTPEPHKDKPIVLHGLSELEVAAKALGMPHVKRHTVTVVGLHPVVMQELEKHHGAGYRFNYIKQDHFHAAKDVPASTDALILCRKKLNNELMGKLRRDAIPWRSISNNLPAAEWALRQLFEEVQP